LGCILLRLDAAATFCRVAKLTGFFLLLFCAALIGAVAPIQLHRKNRHPDNKRYIAKMMKEEVTLSKEMEAARQQQQQQPHQPKLHQPQTLLKLSQKLTKLPPLTTDDKALAKPQSGPSPLRSLLPITLCAISFAVVMSVLIIYMDTTGEWICQYI
jgi:hypothetical protein